MLLKSLEELYIDIFLLNLEKSYYLIFYFIIANLFRPFLRRLLIVFLPFAVAILARKPDKRKIEIRDLFESVFFDMRTSSLI